MDFDSCDVEAEGKIDVLAVVGPTATGKTKLAVTLAKENSGEIISADSIQVYEGLNIGTAKPTEEELEGVNYHLVDFVDPRETFVFSVAVYVEIAKKELIKLNKSGLWPIICGGAGLYVDSLLENVHFFKRTRDSNIRRKLEFLLLKRGKDYVYEALKKLDPVTASKLHKNNIKRMLRALEFYAVTGIKISDQVALSRKEEIFDPLYVGLKYKNRENHVKKINERVDNMFKKGLVEEVKKAVREHYNKLAMSAIGYKEVIPYLNGEKSLAETIERVKIGTRQYAKRQMTWFKRNKKIKWFNVDEYSDFGALVSEVKEYIEKERGKNLII